MLKRTAGEKRALVHHTQRQELTLTEQRSPARVGLGAHVRSLQCHGRDTKGPQGPPLTQVGAEQR